MMKIKPTKPPNSSHRSVDLHSIIAAASTGDTAAFGELIENFQDMAVGYAYSHLADYHLAEDAVQEAFVTAWQTLSQLREPAAFPAWLRRIVFKHCDRHTRRTQIAISAFDTVTEKASAEPGPAAIADAEASRDELHGLVAELPDHERIVVTLFYFSGQPLKVIGRFLDLPETTLKNRLYSARKRLHKRMLSMLEEDLQPHRPSRNETFAHKVMTMIRPSDVELSEGSGTWGCAGTDIWATITAAVNGDAATLRKLMLGEPKLAHATYWYTQPLHFAVREGHREAVEALLEAGADPTSVRFGGEDLKIVARDRGHEAVAQIIDEAQQRKLGDQPEDHEIHLAINAGNIDATRALLTTEPALAAKRDALGRTPLHIAVAAGNRDLAGLLIDMGADLQALTGTGSIYAPSGFTPLDMAIWESDFWIGVRGDWAMVDFLLERGASYPLAIAAARGDEGQVKAILAADASQVNTALASGRRALSSAVQFGHLDLAKRLLDAGADPSLPEGRYVARGAALYFAARDKHYELVSLLLEHGAHPDSGIDSCGTAYEAADKDIRALLHQYGVRVTMVDLDDTDAVAEWAARDPSGLARTGCGCIFTGVVKSEWDGFPNPTSDERKEEVLRMLLAHGVRVPPVVTGCRTYLWHKPKFTRILLEHGMDPNLPNWQRVTPLHNVCSIGDKYAPSPNRVELAEMFLEFGADINARDEEYRSTPLGWAARNGLADMVLLLLEKGAAASLPDDEAWATPLAWAEKRGHNEIASMLRKHIASTRL